MSASSRRWRWIVATAIAPAIPVLVPHGSPDWLAPGIFGLAFGALEALAVDGTRALRVRWLALTSTGAWLAFPAGLMAGVPAYVAVAWPISLLGLTGDAVATPSFVGAVLIGATAGGALVGLFQSPCVRERGSWIVRSAIGGAFLLPASFMALYGPSTSPAGQPPALVVIGVALAGGAIYGLLTSAHVPTSN